VNEGVKVRTEALGCVSGLQLLPEDLFYQ